MMPSTICMHARWITIALIASTTCLGVSAQQAPITGQMLGPTDSPAAANAPATSPTPAPIQPTPVADATPQIGDVTRQLLSMQAQGTHAGKLLPIPGQQASASYQRYLKSFEHPIPEFYEAAVSKNSTGGSGSSSTP
ncbi:hypothetical protein DyAD56_05735 [Dyella sp. AD56]|nr:hypothetical protein DyAD56_05735 [Dyella sp. AD56]